MSTTKPSGDALMTQTVNLADRSDVDREVPGGGVIDKALDTSNGLKFVSDPLPAPIEISGLFSGRLDFIASKRDFDFNLALYEPRGSTFSWRRIGRAPATTVISASVAC